MKNAEFLTILEKGDKAAMLAFLKSLTKEERRKLVPDIKEGDQKYENWESRKKPGGWDIVYMLRSAHMVCNTASEAKSFSWWDLPNIETIEEILEWYQPEWFSDFINRNETFTGLDYKRLVYWQHRGWVNPTPETIVRWLPGAIIKRNVDHKRFYTTEALELYPITLDEHIWLLFYYPSDIEREDVAHTETFGGRSTCWCTTFKKYIDEGRLDRMRILRESLLAINRNFNKVQTGWFTSLFLFLEPTPDELFELHEELFATLTCVWTKPVNATLTLFKKMAKEKRFPVAGFLPHVPALLSAEGKSIVTSTLAIIETLLKQKSGETEELCSTVCTAFLSKDEDVQKKAATIIAHYAEPGGAIGDVLSSFADNILMSVKPLLQAYLTDNQAEMGNTEATETNEDQPSGFLPLIREDNRISTPETFEEFAFSLSTLLDVGEDIYFDLLMDGIVAWAGRTSEENLILLDPAFQKAYKRLLDWNTVLSDMPALIAIHYYEYLQKKFPGKLQNIAKIKKKAEDFDKKRDETHQYLDRRIVPFKNLEVRRNLIGYKSIALAALDKMQQNDPLPLLSTPTHLPVWIDPVVLVTKLVQYQQRGETPNDMDMQLAVQRCALDDTREALALATEQLTGELRNLILFLFGQHKLPQGEFEHPSWWMTAGITCSPGTEFKEFESFPYEKHMAGYFSDNIEWETYMEEYIAYGDYNSQKQDYDRRYPAKRPALKLNVPEYKLRESNNAKDSDYLFLEYLMNIKYAEDANYQVTAIPNTPDAFYAYTAMQLARWRSSMWEVTEQQLTLAGIKHMHELETPLREMHYLLLACCLTGTHKPTKDYALDVWTSRISAGTIDNVRLGTAIGKYLRFELVPLKRFTDLLSSSMTGISPRYNRAALELVEAMLRQLNPEPIKNLKKLLENYKELLALNSAKADFEGIPQLGMWGKEKSLKKTMIEVRSKNAMPHG